MISSTFFSRTVAAVSLLLCVVGSALAQTNELAEAKRFIRGTSDQLRYQTFIIPLDSQKGVQLDSIGSNQGKFGDTPWFARIDRKPMLLPGYSESVQAMPVWHVTSDSSGDLFYDTSEEIQNPLVAFGGGAGGTPLYTGQKYRFGIYGGKRAEGVAVGAVDPNSFNQVEFYVFVYRKSAFFGGVMDVPYYRLFNYQLPRKGTAEWDDFRTNGYQGAPDLSDLGIGLSIRLVERPGDLSGADTYGVTNNYESPFELTISADNADYFLVIGTSGGFEAYAGAGAAAWYPSTGVLDVLNGQNVVLPAINPLAAINFEPRPAWRSTFIHAPHFDGEPIPPEYQGKSLAELQSVSTPVTTQFASPTEAQRALDNSPELRRHPILDDFVADMGNNPIALANYVINEIQLCDAIGYNDNGDVAEVSINAGGVNRGALATFLEEQGSPVEQCALLVYLLRQAGYPATYVFPAPDELKMLDSRMSKLLRMQFKGLVNEEGEQTLPSLLSVNYPWVAVSIPDPIPGDAAHRKWVHVFPWLKDTEIKEGGNVYDYMPEGYRSGFQWMRKYLFNDSAILSVNDGDDTVGTLFPAFVKKQLQLNHPEISYDRLGIRARDRRNYYSAWEDFPQPWSVTEDNGTIATRDNLSSISSIFDTVAVEIWSDRDGDGYWNSGEPRIQTGELNAMDLHNRRFFVRFQQTSGDNHNMILSLAPYRPGTSGTGAYGASSILLKQQASVALGGSDYDIKVRLVHKRQRGLSASFKPGYRWDNPFGYVGTRELDQTLSISKGDLAAICINLGRVTRRMVDVHAQEFWAEEKRLKENPSATGDPEIYIGSTAYLMGMSYYEKVAGNQVALMDLHKNNIVSTFAHGLAKLGARRNSNGTLINNGEIDLVYPVVDMSFRWLAYAGNGTARPDQGAARIGSMDNFIVLAIGDISAQEHAAINTYFRQFDSVSTVRLLHLAQEKVPEPRSADQGRLCYQGERLQWHEQKAQGLVRDRDMEHHRRRLPIRPNLAGLPARPHHPGSGVRSQRDLQRYRCLRDLS